MEIDIKSNKLHEIEKMVILETLKMNNYNRTHTCKQLGIGIRSLQRRLIKWDLFGVGIKKSKYLQHQTNG